MGKIDHLLTVIDEPTASLHPMEAKNVIKSIFELSNNNTILLVEHNTELIKKQIKHFILDLVVVKRWVLNKQRTIFRNSKIQFRLSTNYSQRIF